MPLIHGKSDASRSKNIATEIRHGKSPQQAAAIAYSVQRENMAEGGEAESTDDLLDQVATELLQAIEHKDKKMLIDALTALCMYIQDEDQRQDQEMMEE